MSRRKMTVMTLNALAVAYLAVGADPEYDNTYHPTRTGTWSDVGMWYNDKTKAAATAIPGSTDYVRLNQNGCNVSADGCDVVYSRLNVGDGTSVTSSYSQVGGTLTSSYWTNVGAGGTGTMYLENVDAVLSGYRLSVGNQQPNSANPGTSVFRMKGGSLTTDYTDGLLTSTWGRNTGTSTLDFDGTTWTNKSAVVKIGYGSINTNRVLFKNGTFQNEKAFQLGAFQQNTGTTECGYDEAIFESSVWTNKGEVVLGRALQHKTRLVLSNMVFAAMYSTSSKSSLSMGINEGSDDTLEIVACPQFYCAKAPEAGAGVNSTSHIIIKGQKGADFTDAKTIFRSFSLTTDPGRTYDVVIDESDYDLGTSFTCAASAGQDWCWTFRNCEVGSDDLSLYLANNAEGRGKLVVDGGEGRLVVTNLHMPRQGYGELHVLNGATVVTTNLYGPNMTGSVGKYVIDGGELKVLGKMAACNQAGSTGELWQVSGTFDCRQTATLGFCSAGSSFRYVLQGGVFKGSTELGVNIGTMSRSVGVVELLGGVFETKCFSAAAGTASGMSATLLFNGGTLKATVDLPSSGSPAFIPAHFTSLVGNQGAVIDLAGHENLFVKCELAHDNDAPEKDGGLRVKGAGSMSVTVAPSFTGDLIVDEGTLTFTKNISLGAQAALGGGGTLVLNNGQTVTVGGDWKVDTAHPNGLTVQGGVAFGAGATVSLPGDASLEEGTRYTLVTATTITGVPTVGANIPADWRLRKIGNSICLKKTRGFGIIFR